MGIKSVQYLGTQFIKSTNFCYNQCGLNTTKYQIQTWDVGLYQVSQALKDQQLGPDLVAELRQTLAALAQRLEVKIRDYGFLR